MVCGEIIEERTIKYFSTVSHAINVLREDGTRQAYVPLPENINKEKGIKGLLKRLFRKAPESNLHIVYPVITEGAAIQHYFLYRGELQAGIWWD